MSSANVCRTSMAVAIARACNGLWSTYSAIGLSVPKISVIVNEKFAEVKAHAITIFLHRFRELPQLTSPIANSLRVIAGNAERRVFQFKAVAHYRFNFLFVEQLGYDRPRFFRRKAAYAVSPGDGRYCYVKFISAKFMDETLRDVPWFGLVSIANSVE